MSGGGCFVRFLISRLRTFEQRLTLESIARLPDSSFPRSSNREKELYSYAGWTERRRDSKASRKRGNIVIPNVLCVHVYLILEKINQFPKETKYNVSISRGLTTLLISNTFANQKELFLNYFWNCDKQKVGVINPKLRILSTPDAGDR